MNHNNLITRNNVMLKILKFAIIFFSKVYKITILYPLHVLYITVVFIDNILYSFISDGAGGNPNNRGSGNCLFIYGYSSEFNYNQYECKIYS